MEIIITSFFENCDSHALSGSIATHGVNAGMSTWNASLQAASDLEPPLLDTFEKCHAARVYFETFGAWDKEEIEGWNGIELNALLLQLIASDINDCEHLSDDLDDCDWVAYENDENKAGNLFLGIDSEIYFLLGS